MTGSDQVASTSPEECPECGGSVMTGDCEAVCSDCGLVVGEHTVDHGPDWRDFGDAESDPDRASPVTTLRHDDGLGTGQSPGVTETKVIEGQITGRPHNTAEIYLRREVYRLGGDLDWSDTHKERAADIVADIYDDGGGLLGRDADTAAAAVCWLVCRIFRLGFAPDDVLASARDVDRRSMIRRSQALKRDLGLPVPLADYQARVRRIGAALDADRLTIESAVERVRGLDGTDKSGVTPSALAATALYIESDYTQDELADAADVTPVSIREHFDRFDYGGRYQ
jgi:transcription initiation factor TFIIB